ncbi:MAG TPA: protein kinase [Pyrinomonadaceae bacterium]|nr:protein kinase [Pyrinomonadaceae bacterium]
MTLEAGTRIGRYEIQSLIGVGGMGEVYLAQDTELDRPAALKFLPHEVAADPRRMSRFVQEAKAASALNHPNILTVYDIGQTGEGQRYFASEFVDGVTLREHLKSHRVKLGEVLDVCSQVASALVAAHAAGIVHRDIKPDNIMVRRDGYVKVLDFGLAKLAGRPSSGVDSEAATRALVLTEEGTMMGTVSYMSPEQASGGDVDARTDVWSLGVVLYEMLTGHLPFKGKSASHTIVSILDDEPPPLSHFLADAPEALQEIIDDALNKDRDARFQTAKQMHAKLQRLKRRLDAGVHLDQTVSPDVSSVPSGEGATRSAGGGALLARTLPARPQTTVRSSDTLAAPESPSAEFGGSAGRGRGLRKVVVGALAVALVAGLAVAGYRLRNRLHQTGERAPFASLSSMKLTKLTASGATNSAAISPDGKYAARIVWEGGRHSLRLRQLATTSERMLIPPDPNIFMLGPPTFSHDGSYVYYVAGRRGQLFRELFRVSLMGDDPQKLVYDIDSAATLSPDGRRLAFRRHMPKDGEDLLVVANSDGSGEETLASYKLPQRIDSPAWSPDGKTIAYVVNGTDEEGYYVNLDAVSVSNRKVTKVSAERWRVLGSLAWLSDASGLIVNARDRASLPSTPAQVWYVSFPEGRAQKITNDLNNYVGVSLTADSKTLLAKQGRDTANIWLAPSADLARARQLTSDGSNGFAGISWLPDGRVVYDSDASGNTDIWVTDADGTNARQLTFDPYTDSGATTTPDGRYILFRTNRGVGWGIWRMNADGSNARELVRNVDGNQTMGLQPSPDSQWVYYITRDETGRPAVWRVPVEGGEPVKVLGDKVGYVRLSPDGKTIFSTHQPPEPNATIKIYLFSAETGEELRSFDQPEDMHDTRDWSPDGQAIDYVVTTDGVSNIWRLPLNGGRPRQLTDWKSDIIYRFAWSRDGRTLAAARGTATTDLVLIKDFR